MLIASSPVAVAKTVFWIVLLLPIYSYVLYPMLIIALGFIVRRSRPARRDQRQMDQTPRWPPVAIVVSAYNEESHIAALLENLRALDYPGTLRLYIGSDGSSDRTGQILRAHAGAAVRVLVRERNRGKASMLNDLLAEVSEPIVAFTDANTRLERSALRRLVRKFDDPRVGAVCGELTLRGSKQGDNVDGIYWRIERLIKGGESVLGALLGANGGIYAIRRECFVPIRPDTVVDDFCIAMNVATRGRSVIYESEARAVEDAPRQIRDEFRRRVRIGVGNYQAFFRHPEYLFRAGAMTGFSYLSHKVLRWFTPHLLLLALIANATLLQQPLYRALWYAQLATYAICLALYALSRRHSVPRLLRVPVFLVAMNLAFGVGFWRYLSGQYLGSWQRTERV
jgi:cellulose synthase/poly-beta-1,6-N-acetylglucosamine synthase-like glycosyltransferase